MLVYDFQELGLLFKKMGWELKGESFNKQFKVSTMFLLKDNVFIELVTPEKDSQLRDNLKKTGNHMHHLAFEVDSLSTSIKEFEEDGYRFLGDGPIYGFEGRKAVFMHPLSSKGILIELIEGS